MPYEFLHLDPVHAINSLGPRRPSLVLPHTHVYAHLWRQVLGELRVASSTGFSTGSKIPGATGFPVTGLA